MTSKDPFAQKIYLRELADPHLPARYSSGARRRATQLQGFLRVLQHCATEHLALSGVPTLVVADRRDWVALSSFAYGLPLTRSAGVGNAHAGDTHAGDTHAGDTHTGHTHTGNKGVVLLVAADYPERLLHRFDDVLVRAAKAGIGAPGELREFLDLLMGHDWGHAVVTLAGLRTRTKWFDEWLAVYLYLLALSESGQTDLAQRVVAWARLQVAGSGLTRAPLGAFNYPRAKLRLETLLWFQGTFTLWAAELVAVHAWDLPNALNAAGTATKGSAAKRSATKTVTELVPGFAAWLEGFGPDETP